MKTNFFLAIAPLLLGLCTACTSSLMIVDLPCQTESMDNETSYRVLGIGESLNLQTARQQSYSNARQELINRFATSIVHTENIKTTLQAATFSIPAIQNVCEKVTMDNQKTYKVFTAVQISKNEVSDHTITVVLNSSDTIRNSMNNILIEKPKQSKAPKKKKGKRKDTETDEDSEIESSRERFRKYTDERIEQAKEEMPEKVEEMPEQIRNNQ